MTILLALAHAFGTNKNFQPSFLYLGTIIIDMNMVQAYIMWNL